MVYGAGFYSFFSNYDVNCSQIGQGADCQSVILDIESSIVQVYNLNTVGTTYMIQQDGVKFAPYTENEDGFIDTIALHQT